MHVRRRRVKNKEEKSGKQKKEMRNKKIKKQLENEERNGKRKKKGGKTNRGRVLINSEQSLQQAAESTDRRVVTRSQNCN